MDKALAASAILVAASFLAAWALWDRMPEEMASHWDIRGQANGAMPKAFGLLLMPALTALLAAFLWALPKLDPLGKNVDLFRGEYTRFIFAFTAFMTLLYGQTLLWNAGTRLSFNLVMPLLLGGLFWETGRLLEKSKRNWFIGVRTPWTLSSDATWEKTHRLAGRLFKASAAVSVAGGLISDWGILLTIAAVLASAAYVTAYSYFEYRRETRPS
jgi:uncharacterized membrane protein